MAIYVSNRVGLWYNLQLYFVPAIELDGAEFQTELVCGIICNADLYSHHSFQSLVSNRVGLWYNLQLSQI